MSIPLLLQNLPLLFHIHFFFYFQARLSATTSTTMTSMADFHQLHNPDYVNDIVIHQNACELRKLQRKLRTIQRMKDMQRRSLEQDFRYFSLRHHLVPVETERYFVQSVQHGRPLVEGERSCVETAKQLGRNTKQNGRESKSGFRKSKQPLAKSWTLPLIAIDHNIVDNMRIKQTERGKCEGIRTHRVEESRDSVGLSNILPSFPTNGSYDTTHVKQLEIQDAKQRRRLPKASELMKNTSKNGLLATRRKMPDFKGLNDLSHSFPGNSRPIRRPRPLILVNGYASFGEDKLHITEAEKVDLKVEGTALQDLEIDADFESHEKHSLRIVHCDGKAMLGTEVPGCTVRPVFVNSERKEEHKQETNASSLPEKVQELKITALHPKMTMVKFLPREEQSFYMKSTLNVPKEKFLPRPTLKMEKTSYPVNKP